MMIGACGRRAFALGRSSRPLIPGMLMSDRIRMSDSSPALAIRCSASGADCANSIAKRPARSSRRNCWRNSASTSGSSSTTRMSRFTNVLLTCGGKPRTRQDNPEFGEYAGYRIDIDSAAMLFHDDVMAHRKTKPGAFTRRFGREEGIEYLLFYFGRYSSAIVADADLHLVTKILRRGGQRRLEAVTGFCLAFGRSV